ncbi:MAG: hypothetical protein ACOZE5_18240 [Verrucomicrobiota bacterium]
MKSFLRRFVLLALVLILTGAFSIAQAAQCMGTTRKGNQCKNQAKAGSSYCHYHDPAVKHCAATTKDGTPCRNLPQTGSAYCAVHNKK